MDSQIMVENLPLLGVCNLCLNEGIVKSMIVPYKFYDTMELYIEMLVKCFDINLKTLDLNDEKPVVCLSCIVKLRDTLSFRQQVESSLKTKQEVLKKEICIDEDDILNDNDVVCEVLTHNHVVKKEVFIDEVGDEISNDNDVPCEELSNDNDLLNLLNVKKETNPDTTKRKTRKKCPDKARKLRKSPSRLSNGKVRKHPEFAAEVEAMINRGLFPFKIHQNNLSCGVCSEKTKTLDDMKAHTLQHSKKSLHMAFRKMVHYNAQRFCKIADKLRCKICAADVLNYEELKSHMTNCNRLKYNNWNNLPFKLEKDQLDCPVCKKTFINFVSLNTHMNLHYPNYICENCGKAFASKARLRGHIRTHEIGEFPCRYCDSVFDKVTKRENHVSKEHKAGVRYACKRCNISLTSFYARQKHLAEIHNEELKRYKCKSCPQSYITPGHLSSHVRRDHLIERNHKCDKCDLAFYTKNSLKMHMIKHEGLRIHVCNVCQKSYQRKKTLREHLRIHNNDKRFVCPECGRAFTQKCTLKGHMKVHDRKCIMIEGVLTTSVN